MTSDHTRPCKAYTGHHKANLFFAISISSLVQPLLSTIFLVVLWGSGLLFTVGLSCYSKNSLISEGVEPLPKVSSLPHYTTECVGSVTILGRGDPVRRMIYQTIEWREETLSKIGSFLCDKEAIALQNLMRSYSTFHCCDVNINAHLSGHVAAAHPIADRIPNWEGYGLTCLMPCRGPIFNDTHTFSLDLDGATFQSGEQLGFILVKNNRSPVDLVAHMLEKWLLWPNDLPYLRIEDYWLLPGVIRKGALQDSNSYNQFTNLNLNSYSTLYCYIKQDHHYCFIPLENRVPEVKTTDSYSIRFSKGIPRTTVPVSPSSLENSLDAPPVAPLSLKKGAPSLPIINDVAIRPLLKAICDEQFLGAVQSSTGAYSALFEQRRQSATPTLPLEIECRKRSIEDGSIGQHASMPCGPQNLYEELHAAGYYRPGSEMPHHNAPSETFQEAAIANRKQEALSRLLKKVNAFKMRQKNVISTIERTNIVLSNDAAKNEVSLGVAHKTELALSPALEAIKGLQEALKLEKRYQQGIEYSRPTHLSAQRSAVIQTLNNLEEAIYEEYGEVLSVKKSLTLVIEYLEMMYDLLLELFKLDEIDDMEHHLKQLFTRSGLQLTEARAIIQQLDQQAADQQTLARSFRKSVSDLEDSLVAIRKDLVTLLADPLTAVKYKIIDALNLKRLLKLKGNMLVVEGEAANPKCMEEILTNLELAEEEIKQIQEIFNSKDLETQKVKIAKKIEEVFSQAIALEDKVQKEIRLQGERMIECVERLEALLPKMDPL